MSTASQSEAPPEADLLIVGAGAKAAAIAAKVHAVNELGLGELTVTIVEKTEPAASWLGRNGMTSGEEPLAIPPIKDVGFPYQSHKQFGQAGDAIDAALLPFSWQRYATERGEYGTWVNAGSPSVRHRDYGGYLSWVLERATEGVRIYSGRVEAVTIEDDPERWALEVAERGDPADPERHAGGALLLTGPGVHRALPHDPAVAARIFHCDSHRSELARIPGGEESRIAILGGGESALSALVFVRAFRPEARITVFTPTLPMSRGESFLENRVFADPDCVTWERLDQPTRRDFVKHADRGVFDAGIIASLSGDRHCSFELGRALHAGAAGAEAVVLEYEAPEGVVAAEFDYLVNCTGFDLLAQLRGLFSDEVRAVVEREAGQVWDTPPGTEVSIGRALELRGLSPRLHIPGLGGLSQGPGFANLGCLGLTANRVLQPLLPALAADRLAVSAESQ
ncbi:MAG TPA: SidA/IucD/PvdA family monooxygenase [Solirubrobacterales bacterium]|jgi:mycobactin lysine-N-oxygenase